MPKKKPKSYCEFVEQLEEFDVHRVYHDKQYGFPIDSDDELFGRLILEINQAGLSWATILNKQKNFRKAYSAFNIQKIAKYTAKDIKRLLNDSGIIRNKSKVNAAIYNAKQIVKLRREFGSFKSWLSKNHSLKLEDWVKLFKGKFKFTGGEITREFLVSTGYLKGAHTNNCLVFTKIMRQKPKRNIEHK